MKEEVLGSRKKLTIVRRIENQVIGEFYERPLSYTLKTESTLSLE